MYKAAINKINNQVSATGEKVLKILTSHMKLVPTNTLYLVNGFVFILKIIDNYNKVRLFKCSAVAILLIKKTVN